VSSPRRPGGPGALAGWCSPRVELSYRAVAAALEWQRAHLPAAVGLITGDEGQALQSALTGGEALSPELFDTLVRLGLIAFRCKGELGAPACTLGDALTVAAALPAPPDDEPWPFDPRVSSAVFEKLRFGQISEGIVRIQRENSAGWSEHARASRRFILRTAEEVGGRSLAVLLGAGQAFDLPIAELARQFDRLVLIDVDEAALARTIAEVRDPALRARLEPRVMDVTGINGTIVRRIDEAFAAGGSAPEVQARLGRLCRSYRLPDGPGVLGAHEHADLLVSGLLLSQVAWPQRTYAHRLFSEGFGRPTGLAERQWIAPFWAFELLVQQHHINALTRAGDQVVLISDVANIPTMYDAGGFEREMGLRVCGLGVDALAERVPQFLQIAGLGEWSWPRYRPDRRGRPGSRMEVGALVLREPARPA
jgi:hypothetical protein